MKFYRSYKWKGKEIEKCFMKVQSNGRKLGGISGKRRENPEIGVRKLGHKVDIPVHSLWAGILQL